MKLIERAARVCYKSENKIKEGSDEQIIKFLIDHGHEAMLEHSQMSVKFIVNRGLTHEFVRHRLASFAQESTRYCNYSNDKFDNEITVVRPRYLFGDNSSAKFNRWSRSMVDCENNYFEMLKLGCTPQEARGVLPIDLKAEIVITANLREWRHIFKLRADSHAHPDMEGLMTNLLNYCKTQYPVIFDDL